MGPSGSGKSSLLYLLSGLKQPSSGEIFYEGRSLTRMKEAARVQVRREKFGFVFQQPFLLNYLTARENILVAADKEDKEARQRVNSLLDELNILPLADRSAPAHLSGGERQRVIVARAIDEDRPAILFADEPTAALDHSNGRAVIELLMTYRERGTVVVVTHDPAMVAEADIIYHLSDGRLDHIEERRLLPPIKNPRRRTFHV